jgi:putative transcriptional regulator
MESLRGRLIIASPVLQDPNFDRTVVLITEHDEEGAMGLVLNRPSDAPVGDAVPDLAWVAPDDDGLVHIGGPVAPDGVIVLAEWDDPSHAAILVEDDLGFVPGDATSPELLELAIRRARIYAGHAGWGPGQLEGELAEDAWAVVDALPGDPLSGDPSGMWRRVLRRQGGHLAWLANHPPDPSLN